MSDKRKYPYNPEARRKSYARMVIRMRAEEPLSVTDVRYSRALAYLGIMEGSSTYYEIVAKPIKHRKIIN